MSYDAKDYDLILFLAGGSPCSLATTPEKDNWVDHKGGLPNYICRIARAVKRSGRSTSQSIAIAVSRVKRWAAGAGDVTAKTRAKAAKAVAEWEKLKMSRTKDELVMLTSRRDGENMIALSRISNFNTSVVYEAWEQVEKDRMDVYLDLNPHLKYVDYDGYPVGIRTSWIVELWIRHIIVEVFFSSVGETRFLKIPYEVSGSTVDFGDPEEVEKTFVPVGDDDDVLDIDALEDLKDALERVYEPKEAAASAPVGGGGIWPSEVSHATAGDGVWDGGAP